MSRQFRTRLSSLLCVLIVAAGCHPTQPFYFHEDGDLSHYLNHVTDLEYADVCQASLAEVEYAQDPRTLSDPHDGEFWDLSLEEAISIALQNTKVLRLISTRDDQLLVSPESLPTVYDAAIAESGVGSTSGGVPLGDRETGVEAALSAFDAQLSVIGTENGNVYSQFDRPSTFGAGFTPILQDNGGLRTEVTKRTAPGTQYSFRNQTEYSRGNTIFGGNQPVSSIWETYFEVEVRQPLMRGRGTQVNRVPIMIARINVDQNLAEFHAGVRNVVSDIENAYWELYCAYRFLEAAKVGRDSAQVTWKSVYERYQGGTATIQQEAQAREQYFQFRAEVEQALVAERTRLGLPGVYPAERRLRFLMGLAATDGRLMRPTDEPPLAEVKFEWQAIHTEALMRTPELQRQKWVIKSRELQLIAARNDLLPDLDVGASYRWYGSGDNLINADRNGLNFPDPGSTAFDELTEGKFSEASVFLSFQMPVGFRRALSGVRTAELAIARETARLEDMELNVSHLMTEAVRQLDLNYRLAQTQFNRWRAAHQEVESAEALYEGGKETLDIVLDAQRRRADAQSSYYQALCDYSKAIANVHYRKGSLLEYNNIQLAEGPWPEKAYWDALQRARERDASYYLDYGQTRPSVVSQGPVAQQVGQPTTITDMPMETLQLGPMEAMPEDASPAPSPDSVPEEVPHEAPRAEPKPKTPAKPKPAEKGPITTRPDGPTLNAPRRADAGGAGGTVVTASVKDAYDWGHLGLNVPSVAKDQRDNNDGNPLRQIAHEEP
jgi:outer membrane protein TolC